MCYFRHEVKHPWLASTMLCISLVMKVMFHIKWTKSLKKNKNFLLCNAPMITSLVATKMGILFIKLPINKCINNYIHSINKEITYKSKAHNCLVPLITHYLNMVL